MDSIDRDELEECYGDLMDAFEQFKSICKREDRKLFERWKAGGFAVSDEFVSSYPSALEVYDSLMELPVDDDEEEDSELEVSLQGDEPIVGDKWWEVNKPKGDKELNKKLY